MQAARRLYLYVMSGITLGVIAYGLVLLLRVVLDGVLPGREFEAFDNSRQQLSQAIAMLGVGAPVWAVHWWLIQRGLRSGRPEREAERGSGERGLYFTIVLVVSLVAWVSGAIALLHWLTTDLLDLAPEFTSLDPLGAVTSGIVAFLVWLYHGQVRRRDLAAGPVDGPAAVFPRIYLYGVSLGALLAFLSALEAVISNGLPGAGFVDDGDYTRYFLLERAISGIAWGLVWFGHWAYANRLVLDPGWRGAQERVSRTRVGVFVLIIVLAAASTLTHVAIAGAAALAPILPQPGSPGALDGRAILTPALVALAWALVWFAHTRWLRREPAAADPLRALHQERLVSHGVSGAALAMGGAGTAWLLGYLLDVVLGGQRSSAAFGTSYELATWLPLAAIGLGAWAWFWRPVMARRRRDPLGEATSSIRRAFLYLTLAVALVGALAAAALILYRIVGSVVGVGFGSSMVSELSTPLGVLAATVAVLLYHGLQLRQDQGVAGAAERAAGPGPATGAAAEARAEGSAAYVPARRRLELVGPSGTDLEAALAAVRAALPPGIEILTVDG